MERVAHIEAAAVLLSHCFGITQYNYDAKILFSEAERLMMQNVYFQRQSA